METIKIYTKLAKVGVFLYICNEIITFVNQVSLRTWPIVILILSESVEETAYKLK